MFVVFEGIDGSGKTTISNRVAEQLRERGVAVEHIRQGGVFASSIVSRMRELGKDPRNMALSSMAEFLLYCARDAQLLAECIEPAMARGRLVIADRYLYSYEVLAHHGRGVDRERVRPVLAAASGGVWPDLVVLLDADPNLARARRQVAKIKRRAAGDMTGGGSRKGLGGIGVQHRLRAGYLELAEADKKRWLVIDNVWSSLDEVVEAVTNAVASLFEGATASRVIVATTVDTEARPEAPSSALDDGRRAFYKLIETRSPSEPDVAAYLLAGLEGDEAFDWRDQLADACPDVVAYGIQGMQDERAWALRERLVEAAPHHVARSLGGPEVDPKRAQTLWPRLEQSAPRALIGSVDGWSSDEAWALRGRLLEALPLAVLSSLRGLDDARAWKIREDHVARTGEESLRSSPELASPLAASLRGLSSERAWHLRSLCMDSVPSTVLKSLSGLECETSWKWRQTYASQAPKIVLRTFDGQDNDRAWELRRMYAPKAKEALDSMIGLDSAPGWAIREALASVWPSTAVKSLGPLGTEPRAAEFARKVLADNPGNISLLKHVAALVELRRRMQRRDTP